MNENENKKEPGPIRRALFRDVPTILDSMWRRAEFALHRLGTVGLASPNALHARPGWMSPSYVLFIFVSMFAVFGPTLDAMCSVADFDAILRARRVAGFLLAATAFLLFFLILNYTTLRLARNAEELAAKASPTDKQRRSRHRRDAMVAMLGSRMPKFVGPVFDRLYGNTLRMWAANAVNSWHDAVALNLAFYALAAGSLLVIAPLATFSGTLNLVPLDPNTCTQVPNKHLVYAQLVAYNVSIFGGFFIWWKWGGARSIVVFTASSALLAAVIAVLWLWFTPVTPSEAAGGFYPHVYLVVLGILLIIAVLARGLARLMFAKFPAVARATFTEAAARVDLLHDEREQPDVSWLRLWSAGITGVASHLMHFLLLPAMVAFIAPSTSLWTYALSFAFVSFVLLMYATLSKRWEQMLVHIDRWFLVGTPLVVSIFVIAIAIARLKNVQYVTTVLDATPTGVLFIIIVMLYVAAWFFEYWINRWIGDELLGVLGAKDQARKGWLPSVIKTDPRDEPPWAEANGRYVALHSTGRFCALGWCSDHPKRVAFTTYSFAELFYALGAGSEKGIDMAHDVERRIKLYFNVINIALGLALWWAWSAAVPLPLAVKAMVDVQAVQPGEAPAPVVDGLAAQLTSQAAAGRPSIVVAASGGGTRAAVYTAVALEGVAQIDRARDVVLLSGVSGGGVSAAIFASRFAQLTSHSPHTAVPGGANPWDEYVSVVSAPYIQDVLEGMGELRIAGDSSLGALLQESLESRAFGGHARTFGELGGPALILNSAVSGHPYEDSQLMAGRIASPRDVGDCVEQARPYANLAGGRLVFTNLENVSGFPQPPKQTDAALSEDPPDMWLPYSIVNIDAVPLAAASALTANFPPVFSNARVRLYTVDKKGAEKKTCPRSYFVTDGGATENLGLVSALYALRGSVKGLAEGAKISDIHVLAFEASAIDYDYSDDRGIGAATGGSKERINAGLTQMLLEEVRGLVGAHGARLRVHYLPLPVAFRSRGGFGTHWMFAPKITLTNPHVASVPDDSMFSRETKGDFVVLERKEVMSTMRAMFDPDENVCARAERVRLHPEGAAKDVENGWTVNVQHVARWICGFDDERGTRAKKPDYQVEAWSQVVGELRAGAPGLR